ncbi:MAG: hypothetical protein HY266_07695 [Deltaproteobacteria bacterium]|nr:hypothetical protein [Deltaproteobacteria bacterium]
MSRKKRIGWIFFLGAAIIFLLSPPQGYAGREFEEWDSLPRIEDIVFSKTSVGFISQDHRYFIMDRKSGVFQQVHEKLFRENFSDRLHPKPHEKIKGRDAIRASNGKEFQSESAYCGEGANQPHKLWLDGKVFVDVAKPCDSISAVEIIDNQLWLGTVYMGEGGEYPAHGIIVQSLQSPRLIKQIDTNGGLTGDLVRVIRIDTESDKVWVTTERGLNEVDHTFHVVSTHYFYEDFDKVSGKPTVFLSSSPKSNNPLAVISRVLSIRDSKAFYEAVKSIPQTLQDKITLYDFFMYSMPRPDFVPPEMNPLIPFLIEAAQSDQRYIRWLALYNICRFKDKKVYDFMIDMEKFNPSDYGEAKSVKECLTTYAERGLIEKDQVLQQIKILTERMQKCLTSMRQSNSLPSCVSFVVEDVKSLKAMDSNRGIEILNDYFRTTDGNSKDAVLYETLFEKLWYEDELIPAAFDGIKRLKGGEGAMLRGCMFFDMRSKRLTSRRYDARHVEAIIIALEHMVDPYQWMVGKDPDDPSKSYISVGPYNRAIKTCTEALKSQLANDKVKEKFVREIYPHLSGNQRELADKFVLKRKD